MAADTERDNWMSAEEAKEYGLVDRVVVNRLESEKEKDKDKK